MLNFVAIRQNNVQFRPTVVVFEISEIYLPMSHGYLCSLECHKTHIHFVHCLNTIFFSNCGVDENPWPGTN